MKCWLSTALQQGLSVVGPVLLVAQILARKLVLVRGGLGGGEHGFAALVAQVQPGAKLAGNVGVLAGLGFEGRIIYAHLSHGLGHGGAVATDAQPLHLLLVDAVPVQCGFDWGATGAGGGVIGRLHAGLGAVDHLVFVKAGQLFLHAIGFLLLVGFAQRRQIQCFRGFFVVSQRYAVAHGRQISLSAVIAAAPGLKVFAHHRSPGAAIQRGAKAQTFVLLDLVGQKNDAIERAVNALKAYQRAFVVGGGCNHKAQAVLALEGRCIRSQSRRTGLGRGGRAEGDAKGGDNGRTNGCKSKTWHVESSSRMNLNHGGQLRWMAAALRAA